MEESICSFAELHDDEGLPPVPRVGGVRKVRPHVTNPFEMLA